MPYIKPERRVAIMVKQEIPLDAGELNFQITTHVRMYIEARGKSYRAYNDVLGALSGVTQELYRREIAPYEDMKKELNGDVYV
jgi:hypothetical protein